MIFRLRDLMGAGRVLFSVAVMAACTLAQTASATQTKPIVAGEVIKLNSAVLGEERELRVYLPTSYSVGSRRYPVIYTLDGEATAPLVANSVAFMTGYSAVPQMPQAIVIGITNSNRNRDMPIPEGYGKAGESKFLAFIADEVIPEIEKKYRTQPLRVLVGHSQGGLLGLYAMAERPTTFRWILSLDAPLAGFPDIKPLTRKVIDNARAEGSRGRLVSVENLYGWRNEWQSLSQAARPGFEASQIVLKGETHETMAYKGVYEGLKRLFHDYAPNLIRDRRETTLPELERRYADLSATYGYKVEIPNEILLIAADQNIALQHGEEALALVKHAISIYGPSFGAERRLNEAEASAKKGRDPKLDEWAKMPLPAVETLRPFLGTWERREEATWMISFASDGSKAKFENTVIPPSFEPFHLEVQFVKVLGADRIQWGERNGRGPGVTVFTATLTDPNTLEGSAEGFGFMMPRPPFKFTYKKRKS